jgi:AraC-like DNA-binding protein
MVGFASPHRSERVIDTAMDQRISAAIAFMNNNLHRKLTPIEIAQAVRLSPSHLRSLFKTETGMSLSRYFKQLRLHRAEHLLETTFLTIKEVAATVGLGRVSHFVRDFKAAYGITPALYSKRYRKARPPS